MAKQCGQTMLRAHQRHGSLHDQCPWTMDLARLYFKGLNRPSFCKGSNSSWYCCLSRWPLWCETNLSAGTCKKETAPLCVELISGFTQCFERMPRWWWCFEEQHSISCSWRTPLNLGTIVCSTIIIGRIESPNGKIFHNGWVWSKTSM